MRFIVDSQVSVNVSDPKALGHRDDIIKTSVHLGFNGWNVKGVRYVDTRRLVNLVIGVTVVGWMIGAIFRWCGWIAAIREVRFIVDYSYAGIPAPLEDGTI